MQHVEGSGMPVLYIGRTDLKVNNLLYLWYYLIIPINNFINMTTAQGKYLPQKKLIKLTVSTKVLILAKKIPVPVMFYALFSI
jgi:hypothetical protein